MWRMSTLTRRGHYRRSIHSYRPRGELLEDRRLLAITSEGWVSNAVYESGRSFSVGVAVDADGNAYVTGALRGTARFGGAILTGNGGGDDIVVAKVDPAGTIVWAVSVGGAGDDWGMGVAVDASGNLFLAGRLSGTATFGATTLTSRGAYDIVAARLDPANGNFLWATRAGGDGEDYAFRVTADSAGGVYLTGSFAGPADFGHQTFASGDGSGFLSKVDAATGEFVWTSAVAVETSRAKVGSQGNIFVGAHGAIYKFGPSGGAPVWEQAIEQNNSDRGIYEAGPDLGIYEEGGVTYIYSYVNGGEVGKYQDNGLTAEKLWGKSLGIWALLPRLAVDASGNVYVSFYQQYQIMDFDPDPQSAAVITADQLDAYHMKLDADGNFVAARQSTANNVDDIALDALGNIYTAGYFASGNEDRFDIGTAMVPPSSPLSANGWSIYVLKTVQTMGGVFGHAFNDLNNDGAWLPGSDFDDLDGNGFWNGNETGEPSYSGATVYIDADGDQQLDSGELTATVAPNGEYRFRHVPPGQHTLRLARPATWTLSLPAAGAGHTLSLAAGAFVTEADFGVHTPSETRNYVSTDVPKRYPKRTWQEEYSYLTVSDSYPIFGVKVSTSVSATPVQLRLYAPDGASVEVAPNQTIHLNNFNYKNVQGTWALEIRKVSPDGSLTGWSMEVLGEAAAAPPPGGNDIYVWDIDFNSRTRGGKHDEQVKVTVRRDSDADGIAESSDAVVSGASVTVAVAPGGVFSGVTDSSGVFTTSWINGVSGNLTAEVTNLSHSTYAWNGALDPTANDGDSDNDGLPDQQHSTVHATTSSTLAAQEVTVTAAAGDLDAGFGVGGLVTANSRVPGRDAALQADGKIVSAGGLYYTGNKTGYDFAVVRHTSSGALDTSFGKSGVATVSFLNNSSTANQEIANAVLMQPDGKILVAGMVDTPTRASDMALLRLNANGTIDTSFGGKGKVVTDVVGGRDFITDMALQSDGKIVVVGDTNGATGGDNFLVARYTAAGKLDTTFGSGGIATIDFSGGGVTTSDHAAAVVIQSDGKIVVVGSAGGGEPYEKIALARFTANGALDSSFGAGGKVITNVGSNISATDALLDAAGNLVVAGHFDLQSFAALRYGANGALDAAFGVGGVVRVTGEPIVGAYSAPALAMQSDGKLILAGQAMYSSLTDRDFAVARLNGGDGSLDATFSGDGWAITDFHGQPGDGAISQDEAAAVVVQPDGKIVVVGSTNLNGGGIAMARYLSDEAAATDVVFAVSARQESEEDDTAPRASFAPWSLTDAPQIGEFPSRRFSFMQNAARGMRPLRSPDAIDDLFASDLDEFLSAPSQPD